jgi:hypothetical protein
MKNILLLTATLFIIACNNSADENANETVTTDTLAFGQNTNDTLYFWNVDNEHSTRTKVLVDDIDNPNVQAIINGINMVYPDVLMQFVKTASDTLYITIPQSEKLTQQMGSAGAAQYFATACINLFEIKAINYINFDFKEGDHAKPGIFGRGQFAGIKETK